MLFHKKPDSVFRFAGGSLVIPADHALPEILAANPGYAGNLARLAEIVISKYPETGIIDIGANIGDSAALLRSVVSSPILCVEGYEPFLPYLRHNVRPLGAVTVREAFVQPNAEPLRGSILERGGTASLVSSASGEPIPAQALGEIVAEHPLFRKAKLWKIDTDGLDASIIRGNGDLIANARPVIYFEYTPDLFRAHGECGTDALQKLLQLGYGRAAFAENTGDYLLTVGLEETEVLQDLDAAQTGRGSSRYWDVVAFHAEDLDLAERFRKGELTFWRCARMPG